MADQPINQQSQITPNEAMKIVFLAKQAGNGKLFLLFQKQLADEHIPWSLTDERFLQKAEELRAALITELGLQNEAVVKKAAEESFSRTLSQEEREGMELGFAKIQKQEQAHQKNIFNHTESLVNTYIGQLKTQGIDVTNEQKSALHKSAIQTIKQGGAADLSKNIITTAASLGIPETTSSAAATSLKIPDDSQKDMQQIARYSKITEIVLTGEDDIQKGTLVQQCLTDTETPPEIVAEKYKGSLRIEKAFSLPDDIKQEVNVVLQNPVDRKIAFTQAAESIQKGVSQPIGDVITAIGGPQGKDFLDKAIDEVLGGSGGPKVGTPRVSFEIPWGTKSPTTTQGVEGLLKELKEKGTLDGKEIKKTPLVEAKIKALEQSLIERRANLNTPRALVNDTMVTSAANMLAPQIREGLAVYLETSTIQVHTNTPTYFHYVILAGTDIWNSILGRAAKKAAGEVIKKAAAGLTKKGAQAAATTAGKTAITAAAAAGGTAIAGPIGTALAWIGTEIIGRAASFVWKGIRGLFSAMQIGDVASGIKNAFGAQGPQKPWYKQEAWIIPLIAIGGIFFSSGFTLFRETTVSSAVVAEKEKTTGTVFTGRGFPHGDPESDAEWNSLIEIDPEEIKRKENLIPIKYCETHPNAEVCKATFCTSGNCAWPTIGGVFTQGPGDTYSHNGLNAVDIGVGLHTPVFALTGLDGGVVITSFSKYADESGYAGSKAGYGNYIDIQSPDGYVVRYAHLSYDSMPAEGTIIQAGQTIGLIGETGNTSGPHVHIEVRGIGGPSILSLIPSSATEQSSQ